MSDNKEKFKFLKLAVNALDIWNNDQLSDEEKYDRIFSEEISKKMFKSGFMINYYDPDTTYYEDVLAFIDAVNDSCDKLFNHLSIRAR